MRPTVAAIHRFSISKAHETQLRLSRKIIHEDRLPQKINCIAGIDVAYSEQLAIGAVAVLDYESLEPLEFQTATCKVQFPYIPTLLSFREIPPTVACIKKLKLQPDVLLVDGQGIAHPYGCGFASHLGLAMGKPTIGVAKSRLIGKHKEIVGDDFLVQKERVISAVVTTKVGAKPVYVSVGHLISLGTAVKIVKHCVRNSRIPQPLLRAHRLASEEKKRIIRKSKDKA
ncbi:MAG: endonuclease V [Candidatus Bathyarchaeota archaeon]|nr:MAG: endonuclease V [Candidatus Bathyarchaeota archaeon]